MEILENKKKCIKCDENKNLKEFSNKKNNKDGKSNVCKKCHSKYRREHYLKNKNKILNQVIEYKKNNPDKYNVKYKNTIPNKKAGRVLSMKCCNKDCQNIVYATKIEIENNIEKFCCYDCRYSTYSPFTKQFNNIKKRVKKKDFEFDLTKESIKELFEKQNGRCAITGVPLKFGEETKIYETPSLDRIDNSKGYTKDNVQWVMLGINYMKLNHSNDDLIKTLNLIVENFKNTNSLML